MDIQVGKPVTGKNLIGRETEIKTITELLKAGQSVVIIAPRRFGKTSVLYEAIKRIRKKDIFTCYVDLFSVPNIITLAERITESVLANNKLSTVFHKLKDNAIELAKQFQIKQEFEGTEFILGFAQKNRDDWNMLEKSIDFLESYSIKKNTSLIAAFDEFGDVKKLDGNHIIKLFRLSFQHIISSQRYINY